ncbi:ABC transporter ATP-binding protein [Priestia koreensis]|uniref:ABC transporter ATP-binding protein n=1 Tax=Priestia koreensis TaxID=284581 RepID=UPI002041B6E7|nr:ABC transporter ATP-binding protein [Priestia koreensis]MCM3005375.1 ABC transporter ATP-binding protein [Priestia koreensis]
MKLIIELEHVTYQRGTHLILQDLSFTIMENEHCALLGLNGSGKTTLLNMINGYIWPSRGKVRVLGHPFGSTNLPELRKSIGWVSSSFQERIHPTELAQEIVISGKYASIGLYEDITQEDIDSSIALLERVDCLHLANRPYSACSQGEKQKILIARALMSNPDLLILDEPCTGLDLFAREQLLSLVEGLCDLPSGPTLLYVTHHTEEIIPCFKHALLLKSGQLYNHGETKKLLTSSTLSSFFDQQVHVHWQQERPYVSIERSVHAT